MSPNRRIFLNVIATYGRSLYALILGLLTTRWTLNILGQTDYGLYGVVGGLSFFIAFFNSVLACSISRFFAVAIGHAKVLEDKTNGVEECRRWFTTAVLIHTVIPIVLVSLGYPLGECAIRYWLTIPIDRVEDCIWVFRFVCASCCVGMINVPFHAMYVAKQYIAELTIFSVLQTSIMAGMLCYMNMHSGSWFVKYAFMMAFVAIVPQICICVRAMKVFEECRLVRSALFDLSRIKKICNYAMWLILGHLGGLARGQGIAILINKFFGAKINAANSICASVSGHSSVLSASIMGAFAPAITTAYGASDYASMVRLVYKASKFAFVTSIIFVIPLSLELDQILKLWLVNVPLCTRCLCLFGLCEVVFARLTAAHQLAINATSSIRGSQLVCGFAWISTIPVALVLVFCGLGVYSIGISMLLMALVVDVSHIYFAWKKARIPVRNWVYQVLIPSITIAVVSLLFGGLVRWYVPCNLVRIVIVTIVCTLVVLPLVWFFLLDKGEKEIIFSRMKLLFGNKGG